MFKKFSIEEVVLALVALIVSTFVIVHFIFAPAPPFLAVNEVNENNLEFTGDSFTFTGQILPDCRCEVSLYLNEEEIEFDDDGKYEKTLEIPEDQNELECNFLAVAYGGIWNKSTSTIEGSAKIERTKAVVEMESDIKEWSNNSIELSFSGIPNTKVNIKEQSSYFVFKPDEESVIDLSTKDVIIDDSGAITVNLPFDNSHNNRSTIYRINASLDGYAPYERIFKIANLNFDEERMNKEKLAWEEEKEMIRIIDDMQKYSGFGDVQIAIGDSISTSRTIGSRYVKDSTNYHFVSIPVFVKNTGSYSAHANPNYVTIIDGNNRTYSHDNATYHYTNYLDGIDLQPGTYTNGYLAFILPKDQHKFTVVYDNGIDFASKEIYVK